MNTNTINRDLKPLVRRIAALSALKGPGPSMRFGGLPQFSNSEVWPNCTKCKAPLEHICEVEIPADVVARPKSFDCFQFFYCMQCRPWDGSQGPWQIRAFSKGKQEVRMKSKASSLLKEQTFRLISADSLPNWDGIDSYAPEIMEQCCRERPEAPWALYQSACATLTNSHNGLSTFVGGYPHWLQGNSHPECTSGSCNQLTDLLIQIDSESAVGLEWFDTGLAYIFFCPKHETEFQLNIQSL
jgi:hypothetical protein